MSLKFPGLLFAMTVKKDAKLKEELTLMNFDLITRESQTFTL